MTDNVIRREVQRRDDPFGIPACFYWTMDEVADWVDSIGYGKYKENFRSHFINGRKLLTVDACVLPRMGITHFGDILGLCKHIREVLGIQRHLRGYNSWQPRAKYVATAITSGKKKPQFSYRQHANNLESIIQARLEYFRKRNICYQGWSMEKGWDSQIRDEEKVMREKLRSEGKLAKGDNRKLIGGSMQERLREAADRLLSYEEDPSRWYPDVGAATRRMLARTSKPRIRKPPTTNQMGTKVLGHVNWSPVRNVPYTVEFVPANAEEMSRPSSAPGELVKSGMEKGGEKERGEKTVTSKKDEKKEGREKSVEKKTDEEKEGSGKSEEKKTKKKGKIAPKKKEGAENVSEDEINEQKDVAKDEVEKKKSGNHKTTRRGGSKSKQKAEYKRGRSRSKSAEPKGKKVKKGVKTETHQQAHGRDEKVGEKSKSKTKNIPPYHVAAVFHWKKMESSTGYPPLRLDKLKKCGYFYGGVNWSGNV